MSGRNLTVVIGGGQAGLSASYHLTARGCEHVVLERGRIGEAWRSQRWDSFYLNTPNWALRLPGFGYRGPEPDAFSSLAETISYLEDYAASFRAPVREGVEVKRVWRDGGGFVVETGQGPVEAHNVIVAAGSYQRPRPNPLMDALPPDVVRLHTSAYRNPGQVPDGAVLVIGSGQSGCQIAEELLAAGRRVYLSAGRCPWAPRRYRGVELMRWLVDAGLSDQTVDTLPSPAARLACNVPVSGNDGGHDCNPPWLARRGAVLVGRLDAVEGHTLRFAPGLEETLAAGRAFVADFRRLVDGFVRERGLDVAEPEPEEEEVVPDPIPELDLRQAGIGAVIWANGFRPDHSWIEGVGTDAQGWPVQTRGVSPVPGLYFVGLHWLHKRKSALLLGVGEDAEYVVRRLVGSG